MWPGYITAGPALRRLRVEDRPRLSAAQGVLGWERTLGPGGRGHDPGTLPVGAARRSPPAELSGGGLRFRNPGERQAEGLDGTDRASALDGEA